MNHTSGGTNAAWAALASFLASAAAAASAATATPVLLLVARPGSITLTGRPGCAIDAHLPTSGLAPPPHDEEDASDAADDEDDEAEAALSFAD